MLYVNTKHVADDGEFVVTIHKHKVSQSMRRWIDKYTYIVVIYVAMAHVKKRPLGRVVVTFRKVHIVSTHSNASEAEKSAAECRLPYLPDIKHGMIATTREKAVLHALQNTLT